MATHSIFGSTPPAGLAKSNDGEAIAVGNTFYVTGGATGWTCTGGRVYIPAAVAASLPATVTIRAWYGTTDSANNLNATPLREATATVPAAGGWATATWAPFTIAAATAVLIGYAFADFSYMAATSPGGAAVVAQDGSTLAMSAQTNDGNGTAVWQRSYYRYGADAPVGSPGGPLWGADIITDDGTGGGGLPVTVQAVAGSMSFDGLAPTVTLGDAPTPVTINAPAGSMSYAGIEPDLLIGVVITGGGPGSMTYSGLAPAVSYDVAPVNITVQAVAGQLWFRGYAPTITFGEEVIEPPKPGGESLQHALRRLSGTTLDAQGAANVWAGTTGLELLAALNHKNGTKGAGLLAVLNSLAGTSKLGVDAAASNIKE